MTRLRRSAKGHIIKLKPFLSKRIHFDMHKLESDFYRADLEIRGLDHSGPSYQGRVYLNNPKADYDTPTTADKGYAGSFFVFGHGGCLGDMGHCDIHAERKKFDAIPNPVTPENISIIVTDQLKKLAKRTKEFTVTIVPILTGGMMNPKELDTEHIVNLEKISIVTYDLEE
jgi:hypothetical protein